jgi:hypothetical protein
MGRHVIVQQSQTGTKSGRSTSNNNDNMGRKVIVQTTQQTSTTTTGNRFSRGGNNDNMGRQVIVESTTVTRGGDAATGASRFNTLKSSSNNDNMTRKVIVESSTTRKGETSQGSSRRTTHNAGYGGKKTVIETTTTTTTTKGGYGKGTSGYNIEKVTLNKSGAGAGSGSGSSYYKEERRVVKTTGERRPWEVDATNGDEVFAGRHPSDEEVSVSTGGNGYTKYSVKKEVKYQPTSTTKGATTSKTTKFSVQRTSGNK